MFAAAMDAFADNRTTTEKGCPSYARTGDARVDAFFKLVRGLTREALEGHVDAMLQQAVAADDQEGLVDVFVLWASTRDIRGGKGERELAHWMLLSLAKHYPETVLELLPLIPEYGSWKDCVSLLRFEELPERFRTRLLQLTVSQLLVDLKADQPSLCAKWVPRPKSADQKIAKELAKELFPCAESPEPMYRKMIAKINLKLNTVEVSMCGQAWATIDPGKVPARCLQLHRSAFLNQCANGKQASKAQDRVDCAARFQEYAVLAVKDPAKARVHGRVLHPHQMAAQYMKNLSLSSEDPILEAQWVDLRERLKEEMPQLCKMVPLVDVSGSMNGIPMQVAVALGILLSEVGPLKDRLITFTATPQWHQLRPGASLRDKVRSTMSAEWGMSTNFQAALELILDACVSGNVPPSEIQELSLVVFSDMQFDAAQKPMWSSSYLTPRETSSAPSDWATQYERLVRSFEQAGLSSKWKCPFPVPRVIFWNLRGDTKDFPATVDMPGVEMVSGFSPNLLKLFMQGDIDAINATDTQPESAIDSYLTLRKVLDDPRYDPIRKVCAQVGEAEMTGYVYSPTLEDAVSLDVKA
jgi:hypothetical protein